MAAVVPVAVLSGMSSSDARLIFVGDRYCAAYSYE